ncbi:MAG: ABC transporter ATP-binding protein [Idiomarina sp.]|nr:ABC transporter ATP-binding protein [Idiomarina sp.]
MAFLFGEGIHKSFGTTQVLNGIDFSLSRGECLVLLGPSGCGKTTLLNIIAGLAQADTGVLSCDDQLLDAPEQGVFVPMEQRQFAMVFQDFSLWPHMTVAENVSFGLKLNKPHKLDSATIYSRTRDALAKVQMSHFAERKPSELSGGQQQRVAIARAIAVQPRVLLLDEPLSALDARLRDDLKRELRSLLKEFNLTAVYVTHDQSEAFSLGDRVALMNKGRIEQIAKPEILYRKPSSKFTANFIGHANLLPFTFQQNELRVCDLVIDTTTNVALPASGELVVRRELVAISRPQQSVTNKYAVIYGECIEQLFIGEQHEVVIRVGSHHIRGYWQGDAQPLPLPGERMIASFDLNALHVVTA